MDNYAIVDRKYIWQLCVDCSRHIYRTSPPADIYANRVAHLLFGTAAVESDGFRATRQYGADWENNLGAFGLWQLEWVSIAESIKRFSSLTNEHRLGARCAAWLFQHPDADPYWYSHIGKWGLLHMLCGWHRAACLFARLHYLWEPTPVPATVDEQAAYWKQYYNTVAGKGTPIEYVRSWVNNLDAIQKEGKGGRNADI